MAADKLIEMEVRGVMNDLINKVSQANIEYTLQDVVSSLQKHVDTVNEITKQQYEDFNKQLKESFGYNMAQIQDTMANLTEEVFSSKNNMLAVANKMQDLDLNTRKQLSEINDKVEVDRLVSDLVNLVVDL